MVDIKAKLQERGAYDVSTGQGWDEILINLDAMIAVLDPDYVVRQVKTKFGGLRFYYATTTPDSRARAGIAELVRSAEEEALRTCENCGQPGVERRNADGYFFTSCDAHSFGAERVSEED